MMERNFVPGELFPRGRPEVREDLVADARQVLASETDESLVAQMADELMSSITSWDTSTEGASFAQALRDEIAARGLESQVADLIAKREAMGEDDFSFDDEVSF